MDLLKLTPLSYIVVLGASLTNFSMGMLEPTLALYLLEIGVGYARLGEILSAGYLVIAIASLPMAYFASRVGIAKILYIAGIAAAVSGPILYFGSGSDGVYFFLVVTGISQASIAGSGAAILAENLGTKRVAAFALFSTSWMIPPALGAAVSTVWFSQNTAETAQAYSSIFGVVLITQFGLGLLYIGLLTSALLKGHKPEESTDQRLSINQQMRRLFAPVIVLPFILISMSSFLSGAGAGSTLPFLPPYLKSLDASSQQIALLVMVLNISMGIATQFTSPLVSRFGDIPVYIITTLLSVVTLLGIVFSTELTLASAFYIMRGTFANMSAPIAQARLIGYIDNAVRATGSAWSSTARWLGWSIFSPISGRYIESYGYNFSFYFTSGLYVLSMVLFIIAITQFPDLETLAKEGKYSSLELPT